MSQALKKAVLQTGPRLLGTARFEQLAARMGRGANLDVTASRDKHLALYPNASIVANTRYLPTLFEAYYSKSDANLIVPDQDMGWAASFAPYYRGYTSVILFNFFKVNYGIRDPILYRYSIFSGREVIWCKQLILSADQVLHIPDPVALTDSLPVHGTLAIEAFHPRISTPGRQIRYFALYHDEQNGPVAGSHSMSLGSEGLPPLTQPSFRGFGTQGGSYYHHSAIANRVPLTVNGIGNPDQLGKLSASIGVVAHSYFTREAPSGCPSTVWHDGPTPHFIEQRESKKKVGACYTAFLVPDFRSHAPLVLISSSQIGFQPRQITVHLRSEDGHCIAQKQLAIDADNATVDLLNEFSDQNPTGCVNAVIEFDRDIGEFPSMPTSYVHIYYRSPRGWSDQVHSHNTVGYFDDPFRKSKSYRCRKFAPYLKNDKLECIYSVINLGPGMKAVRDDIIRIRLYTDTGFEYVVQKKLNPSGITNIRGSELYAGANIDIDTTGIVQIEHETTNFNASWYIHDRTSGHLGVDHFTGA